MNCICCKYVSASMNIWCTIPLVTIFQNLNVRLIITITNWFFSGCVVVFASIWLSLYLGYHRNLCDNKPAFDLIYKLLLILWVIYYASCDAVETILSIMLFDVVDTIGVGLNVNNAFFVFYHYDLDECYYYLML